MNQGNTANQGPSTTATTATAATSTPNQNGPRDKSYALWFSIVLWCYDILSDVLLLQDTYEKTRRIDTSNLVFDFQDCPTVPDPVASASNPNCTCTKSHISVDYDSYNFDASKGISSRLQGAKCEVSAEAMDTMAEQLFEHLETEPTLNIFGWVDDPSGLIDDFRKGFEVVDLLGSKPANLSLIGFTQRSFRVLPFSSSFSQYCGCTVANGGQFLDSPHHIGVYSDHIVFPVAAYVGMTLLRELVRLCFIVYNVVMTKPDDGILKAHWVVSSPFVILFKLFHPSKWAEMVELNSAESSTALTVGLTINLLTEDIAAMILGVFIIRSPILNGSYDGETDGLQIGFAVASIVASVISVIFSAYTIRKGANKQKNNNALTQTSASVPGNPQGGVWNCTSPSVILLLAGFLVLLDMVVPLSLHWGYQEDSLLEIKLPLFMLLLARECTVRLFFVLRNFCNPTTTVVRPGMVAESATFVLFYPFRPDLWDDLVNFSVREKDMTRNRILFNMITWDAVIIPLSVWALLYADQFDYYRHPLNDPAQGAALSLAISVCVVLFSIIRLYSIEKSRNSPTLIPGNLPNAAPTPVVPTPAGAAHP